MRKTRWLRRSGKRTVINRASWDSISSLTLAYHPMRDSSPSFPGTMAMSSALKDCFAPMQSILPGAFLRETETQPTSCHQAVLLPTIGIERLLRERELELVCMRWNTSLRDCTKSLNTKTLDNSHLHSPSGRLRGVKHDTSCQAPFVVVVGFPINKQVTGQPRQSIQLMPRLNCSD